MRGDLERFLEEDAFRKDVTTGLIPKEKCVAEVIVGGDCVLAGVKEAMEIFSSQEIKVVYSRKDGEECRRGETVMKLEGTNKKIFPVIRSVLNLLGRMSGVATLCRQAERVASKYGARTAVTRKTMPGLRKLDKKAARIGGSWQHRKDLEGMVLLKKQHLAYFKNMGEAVKKAREEFPGKIEAEARTEEEALAAAKAGVDIVMLDNFSVLEARKTIKKLRNFPVKIELSGGITFENLEDYASLKPDLISMGCLTKSADMIDFSLNVLQ